jgi:lycopene beta-cyclase
MPPRPPSYACNQPQSEDVKGGVIPDFDYVLVGGGLQNGLIALALRARQPAARIAMVERGDVPGGNHTWCFHAGDLHDPTWIDPLVVARWPGYDVAFPDVQRRLDESYACVSSPRLAEQVTRALDHDGSALLARTTALAVETERVRVCTPDGAVRELTARAVIDARGPDRARTGRTGWQKFLGRELRLDAPHGLERPMLMDACLPQGDGFRFMYLLPLAPDRVLVEDTAFSDGRGLDVAALRENIARYVAARGWTVAGVLREEAGVLPLPLDCDPPSPASPLVAGYGGGWFHPVTGYSFPIAARLAELVASRPPDQLFGEALEEHARAHERQVRFALRLNRMLFRWFPPEQRFRVLERFYRLPTPVIRRFYALELTALDRARIVIGRPPRGLSLRAAFARETP